jgi:hypothetical protein
LNIETNESNLELRKMDAGAVPLAAGTQSITPGVYMIVSSQDVHVTGDNSAFDVVVAPANKTSGPPPPLRLTTASFGPVDAAALDAFFTVPDAKVASRP